MARRNLIEIIIQGEDQATSVLQNVASSLDTVSRSLVTTGAALAGATAPLVAGLGVAVQNATAFEEAMTNAQAILGNTNDEIATLSDEILAIGADSRAGPQAVAESFYDIVSGVADASTHMAILDAAIATSEAGNADLNATTAALVGVMNAYSLSADDAAMVSDIFTQTVASGVVTMDELAAALPTVTGLAASQGVSLDELAGSLALITTRGTSASQGATQLQAAITSLINPNETLRDAFDELGVASGEVLLEQLGLAGALDAVASTSVAADSGMAAVLGSTEALNAALVLSSEGADEFLESFSASAEGATEAARAIQNASLAAIFDQLQSSMSVLSIVVGAVFIPTLADLATSASAVVDSIAAWVQANPELTRVIGEAIGTVFALGSAMVTAGGAISVATLLIGGLLSPLNLVIAATTLLGTAYARNWLGFGDAVREGIDIARGALLDAQSWLSDILSSISLPDLSGFLDTVIGAVADALNLLSPGDLTTFATNVGDDIADTLDDITIPDLTTLTDTASDVVTDAVDAVDIGELLTLPQTLSDTISDVSLPAVDFNTQGVQVSEDLLDAIVASLSIVFGGPLGLAFGAARLLTIAFETDFLGFRGLVEESSILRSVEDGLDAIQGVVNDILSGGDSGESEGGGGSSFIDDAVAFVVDGFQPLIDWFGDQWIVLEDGLVDLETGIKGFFASFEGTETSGFQNLVPIFQDIINVVLDIVQFGAEIGVEVLSNTFTAIGGFLPILGAGISTLITTASRLLEGDYAGALDSFLGGLLDFATGIADLSVDSIIDFVNSIVDVTNIDVEALADTAGDIGDSLIDGIVDAVSAGMTDVTNVLTGTGEGTLSAAIGGAVDALVGHGTTIGQNVVDGLASAMSALPGIIIGAINEAIPNSLDLGSYTVDAGFLGSATVDMGSIDLPDNPIAAPGGSRDSGGMGRAGVPYAIGAGAQPEVYIPSADGQFVPNIDDMMVSMAQRLQEADQVIAELSNTSGGDVYISIDVTPEVIRDESNLVRNADMLGNRIKQVLNSR